MAIGGWFSSGRYVLGLTVTELVAWQIGAWSEVERNWGDRPDRPSFFELYLGPAFFVPIPFLLIVGWCGWLVIRKINPAAGITQPAWTWGLLMLCWIATLMLLPIPGWLIVLTAANRGTYILVMTYGIPLAIAAAFWNAVYVLLAREDRAKAERFP